MKHLISSLLLIGTLFSQNINKNDYLFEPSKAVKTLLESGWEIQEICTNPENASPNDIVVLKNSAQNQRAFYTHNQLIAKGNYHNYKIHYLDSKDQFLLVLTQNGKKYLFSKNREWGRWDDIIIDTQGDKQFPAILLQQQNNFTLLEHKKITLVTKAARGEFKEYQNNFTQVLFTLEEDSRFDVKQYQLYHKGILSDPFYYEGTTKVPVVKNYEIKENRGKWHIFFKGKQFGAYEQEPKAIKNVGLESLVWAAKKDGNWNWYKDGILIINTQPYDFTTHDIKFNGINFALIRKIKNRFELYANFISIYTFKTKPYFKLLNENLIHFQEGEALYGLYQIDTKSLTVQTQPIVSHIIPEDFFDFWIQQDGTFSAYKEGEKRGEIVANDTNQLMVFLINRSLFFPTTIQDENGKEQLFLKGEAGTIGPFISITPLEHPDQKISQSTLYSSLIAQTDEGELAIYTDAIIGPADKITPDFDKENPGKVIGLRVDFANNPHYYKKGAGLVPIKK